jgi:hypothetical protein
MSKDKGLFSQSDLECINAYRIYLQVNWLSEISDNRGTHILQQAIKGTSDSCGKPTLWNISKSTLTWSHQQRPHHKDWNTWKNTSNTYQTIPFSFKNHWVIGFCLHLPSELGTSHSFEITSTVTPLHRKLFSHTLLIDQDTLQNMQPLTQPMNRTQGNTFL